MNPANSADQVGKCAATDAPAPEALPADVVRLDEMTDEELRMAEGAALNAISDAHHAARVSLNIIHDIHRERFQREQVRRARKKK